MSYIHEALKKAQKEKDTRYLQYGEILSAAGKTTKAFSGKAVWALSLSVTAIIFVFVLYSWLDLGEKQGPVTAGNKIEKPVYVQQPGRDMRSDEIYERAKVYHKKGLLEDAKRFYQETLRIDPGHIQALNNLGVICMKENDLLLARFNFEKAVRLKPTYVDAYYNIACVYAIEDKVKKSLANLKKAVSLDQSVKDWAKKDPDLKKLWGNPGFEEIMGSGGVQR
ncbi:MAG: hypothetical protein GY864_14725 [Desulfobacterales bacterium]|nr:hypothetical protein [Desulfobacterales bacterium]